MQNNTNSLPKSIQDENLLVDQLKAHLNYVSQQFLQTENRMEQLDKESSDFYFHLQRVQNAISALKHRRYVQELIVDDNSHRHSHASAKPFLNTDEELRNSIVHATEQGLQVISTMFKPIAIQIPNQILSENFIPNDIYEPIDSNLMRDLPPVIGSAGFNSWNVSDLVDRPTETSEITIGQTNIPITQPKPQLAKEPSPVLEIKKETVVEQPASLLSNSSAESVEVITPKPKNEFLNQLNERLATENLKKDPPSVSEAVEPVKRLEQSTPVIQPIAQPRKSKIEEPPKPLIKDSSSDDELFKAPSVPQRTTPVAKPLVKPPVKAPVKTPESKNEAVQAVKPPTKTIEKPASKAPVKKSLLDDSDDDSFDELFKSPKSLSSKPKSATQPKAEEKQPAKISPKLVEEVVIKSTKTSNQPVNKTVVTVKRTEPKKRSIFDSSSSSDEETPPNPQPKPLPAKAPILAESTDDEMPKNVLNSVSGDFSSRLNQALLKRPPTTSSGSIVKPDLKPDEKPEPLPSTTSTKREPVERKKQESVAALRGKLGDSIAKAHRISASGLDHKTLIKESSSSDEAEVRKPKIEDQTFIQTLKARPRPARAPRSRPPVIQTEEKG
ncbi:hypothetical protein M3Y97_00798000 [Aphelenchoides bicaudatus]|nr:hypothetical protein M3Y97_00798000 [Aphelenchoides bicaudatus]